MTTLRRNLRNEFEQILYTVFNTAGISETVRGLLCQDLADRAMKLCGVKENAFDFTKAGIEWNILAGKDIEQEVIDLAVLEKEAIDAFESAFSIKGNWNWYPAKPQEERVWKKFRERLIELYQADKECFTKYVTWIAQPFSRGTMTGLQIKKNPQDFPDAWASFCMSTKYAAPRKPVSDDQRTDLDAGGIPMSY